MSHAAPRNRALESLFIVLPLLLIGNFLYCLLIPAHEYPSRTLQVFRMVLTGTMTLGLFGIRKRLVPGFLADGRRQLETALFWAGLCAGIGLFAIRFLGGDAAWWTGHLRYELG
jgi:hypothetical protein